MNDFGLSLMLLGALSSSPQVPFWATANRHDLMPRSSGATALLDLRTSGSGAGNLSWSAAASLALRSDSYAGGDFFPAELYGSLGWKALSLDIGIRHREKDFLASSPLLGSVSSTSGNVAMSGNARSMPGAALNLSPVDIPFTGGRLRLSGSFGDYVTTDNRIMKGALVHNTRIYLLGGFGRFELKAGLDHYAMWGGENGTHVMPVTLANYLRVVSGRAAGMDGTKSDRMNVIGNQFGAESISIGYDGDGWKAEFRHDIPYDDKSGMKFQNFPDGVNTLGFSFDDQERWVSTVVYEFHYTRYQSGPIHDREVDGHGDPIEWNPSLNFIGGDNYYNHGEYRSGWTHYGRCFGNPFFFAKGTRSGSWSPELCEGIENNRLRAHHIGVSGMLFRRYPYKLMLSYVQCYGIYSAPYEGPSAWGRAWGSVREVPARQFCSALQCVIPLARTGLSLLPEVYYDHGEVLPGGPGVSLGIRWSLAKP